MLRRIIITLVPFLAIAGCSKEDFPKYTTLGGLRVLALKAANPEASPGQTVSISALVSDIGGNGRSISYTVEACSDRGIGFGADPTCSGAPDRVLVASSSFVLSAPSYTATAATQSGVVPSTILAERTAVEQYNGVSYLVVYTFTAGSEQVIAFKRLVVSTRPVKNSNPVLLDLLNGSSSLTALPTAGTTIFPSVASNSQDIFSVLNGDGTYSNFQERLTTTWFSSDGSFDRQRTEDTSGNGYAPPGSKPTTHSTVIVGVVRDGRGGEDYLLKSL